MSVGIADRPKNGSILQTTSSAATETETWHTITANEVFQILDAPHRDGLNSDEVRERQLRYGRNRLAEAPPVPPWKRFLGQFAEVIV